MTLTPEDIETIASRVAQLMPHPEIALPLRDAMRRTGFTSKPTFQRWARKTGLRSMRGARGRYSVDAIRAAVERATKQKR